MRTRGRLLMMLTVAFILPVATLMVAAQTGGEDQIPARPEGPADIYAAGGCPCVAAHSTTRALYAAYNGPLYQVMRQSDGKTLDIGVVQPSAGDPGGYADAAAQDAFCAGTTCWITTLYDQSGMENHLVQAPRGGFSGPSMGGFNNIPIADMAPITIMGHKVYGIFIEPGMGLRWNDAKGTAVDDQAEGQYWVISGHHYNNGCCFDYGNAETDSRDDGDGTMETTYFGNASAWYHGQEPGPWVMTDQENNLVGCVNPSPNDKYCADLPTISWRFVTATTDGEPHHWRAMGGNAQEGDLQMMYDGGRIINDRSSYDPMRKQGAILLGNGGDNSVGSQGTFYEAAMTAAGTFPSVETCQKVQANIVAAQYNVARVSIAPASDVTTPSGLQTFVPGQTQDTTVTFTNASDGHVRDVTLDIDAPEGWTVTAVTSPKIPGMIAPGQTVSTTFKVTSGQKAFNGDLAGQAAWTDPVTGKTDTERAVEKVRNVSPVKINEFAVSSGSPDNMTHSFIELYNAGDKAVDLSGWSLTHHPTQMPIFSSVEVPSGTQLPARGFYLMALANSGLVVPASKGESTLYVRTTYDMKVGDTVQIDTGSAMESRKIAAIDTPSEPEPEQDMRRWRRRGPRGEATVWQPLPDGPVITIKAGSNNIPVSNVEGFEVGQKMAIGYGATYPTVAQAIEKYEVVTITEVGKPGTQGWLSMDAKAGDTNIKVSSTENISVGDKIRLDIDSVGHGIETVTVTKVGTASVRNTFRGPLAADEDPGTGLELAEPLKFDHASNMPFSARGTGITFEPAAAFDHSSNEPVLALGTSITLDKPLAQDHEIHAVVRDEKVKTAGYQGTARPDQWFGGPAFGSQAGNMVLRDASGWVVDSLNYGGMVDPWAAEGYQATSGAGESGCYVQTPTMDMRRRFGFGGPGGPGASQESPNKSAGRYPDGKDTDTNCQDFLIQQDTSLALAANAGAKNIKVSSVGNFVVGQPIIIGTSQGSEQVVIEAVGTAGGTTLSSDVEAGATVISIDDVQGFSVGQTIMIGSGTNREKAVIAVITRPRRRWGPGGPGDQQGITMTLAMPLKHAYAQGVPISGSGITLATALKGTYDSGVLVIDYVPTPGASNRYTP